MRGCGGAWGGGGGFGGTGGGGAGGGAFDMSLLILTARFLSSR